MSERRGLLIILSSPSGAGKSSLARRLRDWDLAIQFSVSATTRPPRKGEAHGREYYFHSRDQFAAMVVSGDMLEHAEVFDNLYGSPKGPIAQAIEAGEDVLFDVDWQGTQQLEDSAGKDLVSIFILPPSTAELERRLRARAQDAEDVVLGRMAKAADEMSHYIEYHYVIVNNDVDESVEQVQAILCAERLGRSRQVGLHEFVTNLREG